MAGWRDRVVKAAEDRFGVAVVPRERLDRLTESAEFIQTFREEISEVAYTALSMVNGRPQEMRPEARERLSQRSRIALMQDPLAGAEANLLANFAFGRGVSRPDAEDEEVQKIIDEAWSDPVNAEKLTGFEAQRHRSNELLTQANIFPTAFIGKGRVRLAFLDADRVKDIICDPLDDERPLYYVTTKTERHWDFTEHRMRWASEVQDPVNQAKPVYYAHWRNVEDWVSEYVEDGRNIPNDARPSATDLMPGLVYHVRINRIGRSQFGTPPWARTLRFYSAMNSLTEAHVAMAQAASSIIAKRSMQGGPEAVRRNAAAMLSQVGELGAARFGEALKQADQELEVAGSGFTRERTWPGSTAPTAPIGPGSFWAENQSDRLEAVNLSSGAGQAAQTAQIVRAPIAAAANFGQHYLGDASNANLATATSLELPALMNVQSWQETHEQMLRWFTDMVIQEAVRAGRLGGYGAVQEAENPMHRRKLTELRLMEAEDKVEMERRTGHKLGYTFEMPYPGRRNLPDVVAMVQTIAAGFDPNGINVPLRRALLLFLAKHGMQVDDPTAFVDEVLPEDAADPGASAFLPKGYVPPDPNAQNGTGGPQTGALGGTATGAKAGRPANPTGDMASAGWDEIAEAIGDVDERFRLDVMLPLLMGAPNGNGS